MNYQVRITLAGGSDLEIYWGDDEAKAKKLATGLRRLLKGLHMTVELRKLHK